MCHDVLSLVVDTRQSMLSENGMLPHSQGGGWIKVMWWLGRDPTHFPIPHPRGFVAFGGAVAQSSSSHLTGKQELPETDLSGFMEGYMGKGVELSSPNYFWKKPLLKDLEEEKVSSWCKAMVVSLSLPISQPLCTDASHTGCGCKNTLDVADSHKKTDSVKNTDSQSPSSFFSSLCNSQLCSHPCHCRPVKWLCDSLGWNNWLTFWINNYD